MQIQERFSTPEKARGYLEAIQWPEGPVCPFCGEKERIGVLTSAKVRPGLKKCYACRKQFTVTVGTVFEDSHVPLNKWLIAVYLLCSSKKGMSALQLQRMLGLTYKTAWFMFHRLRFAVQQPSFTAKLGGEGKIVECDDTWIGGRNRGKGHARATENKAHVFSILERGGEIRSMKMGSVNVSTVRQALRDHVEADTRMMTDSASVFTWPLKEFTSHEKVDHSAHEYARGDVTTNHVEGYFGLLKRGVHGTFHHVSRKYLSFYLAEFDFRWNFRKVSDGERMNAAILRLRGKRLMLREPVGKTITDTNPAATPSDRI